MEPLVIIGAGGCGREVAWLVSTINDALPQPKWNLLGFVDDSATETMEGYPVLGKTAWLEQHAAGLHVVCAIGNPRVRRMVVQGIQHPGLRYATLIHPSVQKSEYVTIGEGSIICAGAIITTNVKIGRHCLLNLGTRVGHDSTLNDFGSFMLGVNIAGEVIIGEGCYFGLNAAVINRVTVGEWTTVGAGAVVVSNLPAKCVAVGVPAKPIKHFD